MKRRLRSLAALFSLTFHKVINLTSETRDVNKDIGTDNLCFVNWVCL